MHQYYVERVKPNSAVVVGDYKLIPNDTIIVVKNQLKGKTHTFQRNTEYLVEEIGCDLVGLKNNHTGEKVQLSVSYFKHHTSFFTFNYCYTAIQSQGDTYENANIILFDVNDFRFSNRGLYTAISRSTILKDAIYIYNDCGITLSINEHQFKNYLIRRISSHIEADKKAKREYNETDFVDVEWIMQHFQNGAEPCCHRCNKTLTLDDSDKEHLFSIDRIHNSMAHIKNNCKLSCVTCNKSRRDNQLL